MPAPRNRRHLLVRAAPRRLLSASCRSAVSKACCSAWRLVTCSGTRPKGSFRAADVTSATTSRTDMPAVVRLVSRPHAGAGFKPATTPSRPWSTCWSTIGSSRSSCSRPSRAAASSVSGILWPRRVRPSALAGPGMRPRNPPPGMGRSCGSLLWYCRLLARHSRNARGTSGR